MNDFKGYIRDLKREANQFCADRAPSIRLNILRSLPAQRKPKSIQLFRFLPIFASVAAAMIIAILVFIGNRPAPKPMKPVNHNLLRVEKIDHSVQLKVDGVNGPIFIRKASDPVMVRSVPPLKLEKTVYRDTTATSSPIVFYLIETPGENLKRKAG